MPTSLTIALWLITAARAGAGVQLPDGEDPSAWAPAFDFAGLEQTAPGTAPQVRFEAHGERWTLRALDDAGTFRTAEVAVPHTTAEREEVALIAGGLIRAMNAAAAPPQAPPETVAVAPPPPPILTPPPPPPPPARALPSTPPPAKTPSPSADPPTTIAEIAPPPPLEPRAPQVLEPIDPIAPVQRRGSRRDGSRRVSLSPIGVETGLTFRRNTEAALVLGFDFQLHRAQKWALDVSLGIAPDQWIELEGAEPEFSTVEIDLTAMYRFGKVLSAGPMAGLTWRRFIQQGTQVGNAAGPGLGGRAELTAVGGRWWALRSFTEARWDIGRIELIPAGNPQNRFPPFGLQTGLAIVFGDQVDPFRTPRTSRRR